jgi:hypothetical protein
MQNYNIITVFIVTGSLLQSMDCFIIHNPLRQIIITRAISKTIVETMALNVVDESSIINDLSCNCDNHPYLSIYVVCFICFGYLFISNNKYDKMDNIKYYSNVKRKIRQFLFIMLLIFGKNINSVF